MSCTATGSRQGPDILPDRVANNVPEQIHNRIPSGTVPDDGVPNDGVPNDGVPDDGVLDDGVLDNGVPNKVSDIVPNKVFGKTNFQWNFTRSFFGEGLLPCRH